MDQQVGRYVLVSELSRSRMAIVYEAYDSWLLRPVIIKKPLPSATARQLTRFRCEAQTMARLADSNIVKIHDLIKTKDELAIVMADVRGLNLEQWLNQQRRRLHQKLKVFLAAGRSLTRVHSMGIIHRDFKPTNIMVGKSDEAVLLIDFGIVRWPTALYDLDEEPSTTPGVVVGTPEYMAPEQLSDATRADEKSDQFSFCVSLWEAAYGQRPFDERNPVTRHAAIRNRLYLPANDSPFVPHWLRAALERGLHVHPDDRWSSMHALLETLERGCASLEATSEERCTAVVPPPAALLETARSPASNMKPEGRGKALCSPQITAASSRSRLSPLIALGAAALVALFLGTDSDSRSIQQCRDASEAIDVLWTDRTREHFERSAYDEFGERGRRQWDVVETSIDSYTTQWRALRNGVCIQGRDSRIERRKTAATIDCLDERHAALAAMIRAAKEQGSVGELMENIARLPRLDGCMNRPGMSLPPSASDRDEIHEIRRDLYDLIYYGSASADALDQAERLFNRSSYVDWAPLTHEVAYGLALQLWRNHQLDPAKRHLAGIIEGHGTHHDNDSLLIDAVTLRARIAREENELDIADAALRSIEPIVQQVEHGDRYRAAEYWYNYGQLRRKQGDLKGAIPMFERSIGVWDEVSFMSQQIGAALLMESIRSLGDTHAESGDFDEALTHYLNARDFVPKRNLGSVNVRLEVSIANIYHNLGDYEQAEALSINAYNMIPDNRMRAYRGPAIHALYGIGRAQTQRHKYEDAEQTFEELERALDALYADDENSTKRGLYWLGLSELYAERGLYPDAIDATREALDIERRANSESQYVAWAFIRLGSIHNDAEQPREALHAYYEALGILIGQVEAHSIHLIRTRVGMALALVKLGRFDEAQRSLETAMAHAQDERALIGQEELVDILRVCAQVRGLRAFEFVREKVLGAEPRH